MLDFIVSGYGIFIIIAVVLLLGLLGYMIDRRKYEKYRNEILNENGANVVQNMVSNIDEPVNQNVSEQVNLVEPEVPIQNNVGQNNLE